MTPVERFLAFCAEPEPRLDEATLELAACFRPDLDRRAYLCQLDDIAEAVEGPTAGDVIRAVYHDAGFRGDTEDYYDPANSLLDLVLDRRTGIPLSLAVVLVEVARRRAVRLLGVGMPGHFLVRQGDDEDAFFDPFTGASLTRAGCIELWARSFGPVEAFQPSWLEPTSAPGILARMVANLERAYQRRRDRISQAVGLELRSRLPQVAVEERVAAAGALVATGRFDMAAAALYRLCDLPGLTDERRQKWASSAHQLRARLN